MPNNLSLSAVARDANGFPITVPIDVMVELYEGDPATSTNQLYCELVLNLFPNNYGEFSITFGSPQFWCNAAGLDDVDWTTCDIWYKLSWRITGTSNLEEIATNNFSSVPYAFGARTAEYLKNFNTDNAQNGNVMIYDAGSGQWNPGTVSGGGTTISAGAGISVSTSGGNTTITNTGDVSSTNELQSLAISGNTLSISNGNSVTLPSSGSTYTAGTGISISGNTITNTAPSVSSQYASMYTETEYTSNSRNIWLSNTALRVTVPVTGTYLVQISGHAWTSTSGDYAHCALRRIQDNNIFMYAQCFGYSQTNGTHHGTGSTSRILQLSANDILELIFKFESSNGSTTGVLHYGGFPAYNSSSITLVRIN